MAISLHFIDVIFTLTMWFDLYLSNWPNDGHELEPTNFVNDCEVKLVLRKKVDVKFEDEVECEEFSNACETFL
jgi:hypothetical protein